MSNHIDFDTDFDDLVLYDLDPPSYTPGIVTAIAGTSVEVGDLLVIRDGEVYPQE